MLMKVSDLTVLLKYRHFLKFNRYHFMNLATNNAEG